MNKSIAEMISVFEQMMMKSLYNIVSGSLNLEPLPVTLLFHLDHKNSGNVPTHLELFSTRFLSLKLQDDSHIFSLEAVSNTQS